MSTITETVTRCDICGKKREVIAISVSVNNEDADDCLSTTNKKDACQACRERLDAFILRGMNPPTPRKSK